MTAPRLARAAAASASLTAAPRTSLPSRSEPSRVQLRRCVVYPTEETGGEPALPYPPQRGWASYAELRGDDGPARLRACLGSLRSVSNINPWTAQMA